MENMNIESAKYFAAFGKTKGITAVIDGITMSVPLDTANRHYAEILRQVCLLYTSPSPRDS